MKTQKNTTSKKRCTRCGQSKPLTAFSRKTKSKSGHQDWCKNCFRLYVPPRSYPRSNEPKRCASCKKTRRAEEFHSCDRHRDGLQSYCMHCQVNKTRESVLARPERYRELNRQSQKRYRLRHPDRIKARAILWRAVRSGEVTVPDSCEECGRKYKSLIPHHLDYDKPLDVIWQCVRCHKKEHRNIGKKRRLMTSHNVPDPRTDNPAVR